jgi:FkbM family methyltransferase
MNPITAAVNSLLGLTPYRIIHQRNLENLKRTAGYRPSNDALAEHLRQVFQRAAVDCVFDVGANDGTYARFLREKVGYTGQIVSFEPMSHRFAEIQAASAADPKWQVKNCALGASPGKATINIMAGDAFSSFRQPSHNHVHKYEDANKVVATEEVVVSTVADAHREMGLGRFYLKMDTQGFDLEVFKGALPVLEQVPALQSELSFVPIYDGAPSQDEALTTFRAQGYEMSMLVPVGFDESLRIIEADCVLVNPARLVKP